MAPSRAPLSELGSQTHNRRRMASRPQTYGKHRRLAAAQAPIWESPPAADDAEFARRGEKIVKALSDRDDQLARQFEDLVIASHNDGAKSSPEKLRREKTATPSNPERSSRSPVRRISRRTKTVTTKAPIAPHELDVSALLKESHAHTNKSFAEVKSFSDFADTLIQQFAIRKHADGSFGDVYKLFADSSTKSSSKNKLERLGGGVLKIIPLCGKTGTGARKFSRVDDVLSEVRLLRRLDALHGFTRFRDVHIVQGCYPPSFIKAFHDYKNEGRPSDTAPPEKTFNSKQMFAILDMDDAGNDLECLSDPNIFQVHDIFWACAIVLAYGEATVEFEARDMHVGNICIRPFIRDGTMNVPRQLVAEWPQDQARHLGLTGIRVTLIDYTLSRARLEDESVAFMDLKNKNFLYPARGAEPETLQQKAYCQQREVVRAASGGKKENWSRFVPRTNVVWLAYLLETFLKAQREKMVEGSNEHCAGAQSVMRKKLENVLEALKSSTGKEINGLNSAGELLQLARDSVWLNKLEVDWYTQQLESEACD